METTKRFSRGHLENQRQRRLAGRLIPYVNPQERLHSIRERQASTLGLVSPKLDLWKESIPVSEGQITIWSQGEIPPAKLKPLEF